MPHGAGYALHFNEFTGEPAGKDGVRALNMAIERTVALEPGQYLWSYNRYKVPSGVAPPAPGG